MDTNTYEYLEEDFDYKKLTISQLCSILSRHNVDLPSSKQRKDVYLTLFSSEIAAKRVEIKKSLENVKPNGDGIEIVLTSSKIPVLAKSPLRPAQNEPKENQDNLSSNSSGSILG